MEKIRVLQVITRLIVGGAQETVMITADLLDKQRFQVDVISGPQTGCEGSLIEEIRARSIPLIILPDLLREVSPLHDILAFWKLFQIMRKGQYSVVHTNSSKAGMLGRVAAWLARVPVIVHTVHGWSFHDHMASFVRRAYILLERLTTWMSDALIVVTQSDIDKGLKEGIGKMDKYHLIRSAIPLDDFNPETKQREIVRSELGIPSAVPVLGNVGRFSEQKNPLDWIRVASRVRRSLPDCYFLLVGDGPLRSEVERLIIEEDIKDCTVLTGLRRDVPYLLSAMDVFLLTSLWEGLPRVIPQAMAMEIPVVANGVDGSTEVIVPGETGYVCLPGDLDSLAKRCVGLLQDANQRQLMGRCARMIAIQEFDQNQMVKQIELLYERLGD